MNKLFSHFRGDALGGITAGIVALPLALAFGASSGLGASAGLYGAIFISFFASLFGGTPTQISGPTAPMTAVSMVVIAGIIGAFDGNVEAALPSILLVFLLGGVIQIVLGVFNIGKYVRYIPYPVISGFMTAIGVIILIGQMLPFLGYYAQEDKDFVKKFEVKAEKVLLAKTVANASESVASLEELKQNVMDANTITPKQIEEEAVTLAKKYSSGAIGSIRTLGHAVLNIHWFEVLLASLTIFIIYGFKKITTAIPSSLVALIVVSLGAFLSGITYKPIQEIPTGFPSINLNIFTGVSFEEISPFLLTAITLALLGAIDSLLTSVVADNLTRTKHNPKKELIGQGIGNSIAALFGGIPGAGATIRTVVNINAGAKTKLSGIISSILLLVILLALGPVASKIPAAVLCGILITVGIGVMDYRGLKAIKKMPKNEVIIMFIVLILSVFWNLVYAVGVGLVIAALVFMKKMGDISEEKSEIKSFDEEETWDDETNFPKELQKSVFIKHLEGPLFFGYTFAFQQLYKQIPNSVKHLVIRMEKVPYIDQSGLYVLEDIVWELVDAGVSVSMVGIEAQPKFLLKGVNLIPEAIPENQLFADFNSYTQWIQSK